MKFKRFFLIISLSFLFCESYDYRQSLQDGSKYAVFFIKADIYKDSLLILRIKSFRFKYWGTEYAGDGGHGSTYPVEKDLPKDWFLTFNNRDYSFKLDSVFAIVCTLNVALGKQITLTGHSADTINFKNSSFWADAIVPPVPQYFKETNSIKIPKLDNVDYYRITYSDSNDGLKVVFYPGVLDTFPKRLIDHLNGTYYNYEPPSSIKFDSPIEIPNSFNNNGSFVNIDFCNMINDFDKLLIDSTNNIFIPFACYDCNISSAKSGNIAGGARGFFIIYNSSKFNLN